VKITDFGIARVEKSQLIKTRDEGFMGTISYCSPEQLTNSALVDRRSDLFSAAVVLYQFLTGKLPFHGSSLAETINNIIHGSPIPPGKINPSIPVELERVILRALAKNPHNRFRTIGEFKEGLQRSISRGKPRINEVLKSLNRKPVGTGWTSAIPRFPIVVAGILFIGLLSIGFLKIEMEKQILKKDAAIRGSNMAKIFSLLMAEESVVNDRGILAKYVNEVGNSADISFIEMIRDNKLIAAYHRNPHREGEEVYMVSYPISIEGKESGFLKVGFLRTAADKAIGRVRALMGFGFISTISFFLGFLGYTRFRSSPKTHDR
jgi:serine/threonine protein kinase